MAKSKARFSVNLDAIRALAALTVFFFHGKGLFIGFSGVTTMYVTDSNVLRNLSERTNLAHEAVVVFFVLSGYFVGGGVLRSWRNGGWQWKVYAIHRLTRLWIVLFPALILTWIVDTIGLRLYGLATVYGHPHWQAALSYDVIDNLNLKTFLGCSFFLQKILVEPLGTNGALWSLSYEFWFYVAFPIALCVLTTRLSWPWRILNAVILIGLGVFVGGTISEYFLIWLMGAALQLIPSKVPQTMARILVPVGAVFMAAISIGLMHLRWPRFWCDVLDGIACTLLCYLILHEKGKAGNGLYTKLSQGISDMSYTLYLVHLPVLTFICAVLVSYGLQPGHDLKRWLIFACVAAVTFFICYLVYWLFERNSNQVRGYLLAHFAKESSSKTGTREKAVEQV